MANNVAKETPLNNTMLLWCDPVIKTPDPTTGEITESPMVEGAVHVFWSVTPTLSDAEPIHEDLDVPMTKASATHRRYVAISGATLTARLLAHVNNPVHVHFCTVDDEGEPDGVWHETAQTTVRDRRESA